MKLMTRNWLILLVSLLCASTSVGAQEDETNRLYLSARLGFKISARFSAPSPPPRPPPPRHRRAPPRPPAAPPPPRDAPRPPASPRGRGLAGPSPIRRRRRECHGRAAI